MLTKEWFSDIVQYVTHLRTLKFAAFTVLIALGQLPAAESTDNNQRLALMRYDILLREIHSYQVKADDLKGKGEPDSFLRSFHKDRLELTTERSGLLVQLAHRYTQDIQTVDRKALALIRAAKSKYRPSAGVEAGKVPSPP